MRHVKVNSFKPHLTLRFWRFYCTSIICLLLTRICNGQTPYLKKSITSNPEVNMAASTKSSHYKPLLGAGDSDESVPKSVNHYGLLSIDPNGSSKPLKLQREELVYFVLEGTGMLRYGKTQVPISKNDFFYIPINTEHSFLNSREDTLHVMLMGFQIPTTTEVKPTSKLNIASANKVKFQLLPQNGHGPSSRYQLLMGTTASTRDRLASAYQVNSLYIIDFDHAGTNIPHRHKEEEEIYMLLQGSGEMVAGETAEGKEQRFPAKPGDVFFFAPNTLVGFYSSDDVSKDRAKILAIRLQLPK